MGIILIRTGPPYYELIENKVQHNIPKNSILSNNEMSTSEIIERIKYRSIISANYVVKFNYNKNSRKDFNKLIKKVSELNYVTLLVYTSTKDDYTLLQTTYRNFNLKLFDSYNASDNFKEFYITYKLKQLNPNIKLSSKMVAVIRKRLKGYTDINGYLVNLSHENINTDTIYKIIPKYKVLNSRTFSSILFLKRDRISLKSFDELLTNYRYYPKPLVESLTKYFTSLNSLYTDYLSGNISDLNYLTYIETNKINIINSYNAKDILDRFATISPIKMLGIINNIDAMNREKDNFKIILMLYKFIRIF